MRQKRGVMKRAASCRPRKRQLSMSTIDQTALFLVDVDHTALFYWSTSTTAVFYWLTSTAAHIFGHTLCCQHRQLHFSRSTLTRLHFSTWSTSILQPFSSRPHLILVSSHLKSVMNSHQISHQLDTNFFFLFNSVTIEYWTL